MTTAARSRVEYAVDFVVKMIKEALLLKTWQETSAKFGVFSGFVTVLLDCAVLTKQPMIQDDLLVKVRALGWVMQFFAGMTVADEKIRMLDGVEIASEQALDVMASVRAINDGDQLCEAVFGDDCALCFKDHRARLTHHAQMKRVVEALNDMVRAKYEAWFALANAHPPPDDNLNDLYTECYDFVKTTGDPKLLAQLQFVKDALRADCTICPKKAPTKD